MNDDLMEKQVEEQFQSQLKRKNQSKKQEENQKEFEKQNLQQSSKNHCQTTQATSKTPYPSPFNYHKKSPSQYLFLNTIKNISYIYLILIIFYIPIYIEIGQISMLYSIKNQNVTIQDKIMYQGTIATFFQCNNWEENQVYIKTYLGEYYNISISYVGSSEDGNGSAPISASVIQLVSSTTIEHVNVGKREKSITQLIKIFNKCSIKNLLFIPFVQNPYQFHQLYFWYNIVFNLVLFLGLVRMEVLNLKYYVEMEYPVEKKKREVSKRDRQYQLRQEQVEFRFYINQKLQNKKIFHIKYHANWPIYILKPILIQRLNDLLTLEQNQSIQNNRKVNIARSEKSKFSSIKNIFFCIDPQFQNYCSLKNQYSKLQQRISTLQQNLSKQTLEQTKNLLNYQLSKLHTQQEKIALQKMYEQVELNKRLSKDMQYHIGHLWVRLDSFQSSYKMQKLIYNENKKKTLNRCCLGFNTNQYKQKYSDQFMIEIDNIQYNDLNVENAKWKHYCLSVDKKHHDYDHEANQKQKMSTSIFDRLFVNKRNNQSQKIDVNQQNLNLNGSQNKQEYSSAFYPNQLYYKYIKVVQIVKIVLGIVVCVVIVLIIDVLILVVKKQDIFSYSTVFVVVIIEILLKIFIIKFSQYQRHTLYSHEHLSIMLKLIAFLFFNSIVILVIAHQDLGEWQVGKWISTYQFDSINQEWFIKIGKSILMVIAIQIAYCNIRVYIEVAKQLFFSIISSELLKFIKVGNIKVIIKRLIKKHKENYKKPIIDLQICYSEVILVFLIGISFSYLFPVLYPMMFIASITIYQTHKSYIELYTKRCKHSSMILNDYAYRILYGALFVNLVVIYCIEMEDKQKVIVVCVEGIVLIVGLVVKWMVVNSNKEILERLKVLKREQRKFRKQKQFRKKTQNQTYKLINQPNNLNSDRLMKSQNDQQNQQKNINFSQLQQPYSQKYHPLQKDKSIQLALKTQQLILMKDFLSKRRNINQIHSYYYSRYEQILKQELMFLIAQNQLLK